MNIRKRDGRIEDFKSEKITKAIAKAFKSLGENISENNLEIITKKVVELINNETPTVEEIQDLVERVLMELNYFEVAKNYILYRSSRKEKRESRDAIVAQFESFDLRVTLKGIERDFSEPYYDLSILNNKFKSFLHGELNDTQKIRLLIKAATELTSMEAPKWEYIAARVYLAQFNANIKARMKELKITSFYEKVKYLVEHELYCEDLITHYTKEEIEECEKFINKNNDKLISYSSFELLIKRYLVKNRDNVVLETPQEMFLAIAMHLSMNDENKLYWVKRIYDSIAKFEFTLATPTISNARKPFHQLSSCFIDTVDDSLDGIFRSTTNFAKVSKLGGGMGLYLGKVRANGSTIRGFKGAAGGVIRWVRIINDVAVAVDQLGVRSGAVACYLDVWHKDLPEFLQIRTNNGDDRMKAHDVFPAICYPSYFWRLARDNMNAIWYLMDPKEISDVKGYNLEDYFGDEWENKYIDCAYDDRIHKRPIPIKEIIRLIIKSSVETGTPFAFNRDLVNSANPNKHKGIIYCSNLCTEIAQNTSSIEAMGTEIV
ncbi:MAG: ATP cone domain-containing protein, partial [bacterium]|nr:ATP cone domain-containing protein [bacterium]